MFSHEACFISSHFAFGSYSSLLHPLVAAACTSTEVGRLRKRVSRLRVYTAYTMIVVHVKDPMSTFR